MYLNSVYVIFMVLNCGCVVILDIVGDSAKCSRWDGNCIRETSKPFTLLTAIHSFFMLQDIKPMKKASAQRNALASALKVQRKIIKTLNESMDELTGSRKSIWWSKWIPREE